MTIAPNSTIQRRFERQARFLGCTFKQQAFFEDAEFVERLELNGTEFQQGVSFERARFRRSSALGTVRSPRVSLVETVADGTLAVRIRATEPPQDHTFLNGLPAAGALNLDRSRLAGGTFEVLEACGHGQRRGDRTQRVLRHVAVGGSVFDDIVGARGFRRQERLGAVAPTITGS